MALTWISHQYAICLDQLQWLLGQQPGQRARHPDWITEGSARDVVARWKRSGWVESRHILVGEPFWIWPTRGALTTLGLPYPYRNIGRGSLDELGHLYATNEIRLHRVSQGAFWVSERQMREGTGPVKKGQDLLHRPDGEIHQKDGTIIAIEAELSRKRAADLCENLMELVRGERYLQIRTEHGARAAKDLSRAEQSKYDSIWYVGPPEVCHHVRGVRKRMVERGDLSLEEARCIFVKRYPVARTPEVQAQEELEDNQDLDQLEGVTHATHR
jgi:hypothetical protein